MAKKKKRKAAPGDIATNRQASFRYNLLDKFEAGIVLQGSEVKSLRDGGVQLKDAYADVKDGEVWLRNMHIAPYKPARENHEPDRPRKLLLHRREIERLLEASAEKGLTIVPTRIYFNGPRAKVELALAKGKDMYDKRRSIKDRDVKREIDRAMSERYYRSRPRSAAQRVSSCRLDSCSLRSTEDTWASTVLGEISRRSAISLYM